MRRRLPSKVADRARAIHAANGHPKGYQGPCWGALPEEVEQAMREVAAEELTEQGRRLASQRDDLIAEGVDPAELLIPLAPNGERSGE